MLPVCGIFLFLILNCYLGPGSWSSTTFNDDHSGLKDFVLLLDLQQFVGGPGPEVVGLGLFDVLVLERGLLAVVSSVLLRDIYNCSWLGGLSAGVASYQQPRPLLPSPLNRWTLYH